MSKKNKLSIRFVLTPDLAQGVTNGIILGDFNDWNTQEAPALQAQEDGSLQVTLELEAGRSYQYRYLLADGRWVNDHGFRIQTEVYGHPVENSFIQVPEIEKKKGESKKKTEKPKADKEKKAKPEKKQTVAPESISTPSDDLTKIEGIGKKISTLLNKAGIHTYKQLGKATIKSLQAILDEAGPKFTMHNPATWPKQSKLAATEQWEKLAALQETLKGGLPTS